MLVGGENEFCVLGGVVEVSIRCVAALICEGHVCDVHVQMFAARIKQRLHGQYKLRHRRVHIGKMEPCRIYDHRVGVVIYRCVALAPPICGRLGS